ncbi:hypothetical protein GCM10007905_08710 [Mixta theicola]|nr:hypothetical protein GCM10007905_08710 [Mixta theicola]
MAIRVGSNFFVSVYWNCDSDYNCLILYKRNIQRDAKRPAAYYFVTLFCLFYGDRFGD